MWNINAKIKRYDYGFHCSASQSGKTFRIFDHGCAAQDMVITRYIQCKTKRIESTEYENVCGGVYLFIGCSNEWSDSIQFHQTSNSKYIINAGMFLANDV